VRAKCGVPTAPLAFALAVLVFLAFAVESALGFGAMLLSLALGSLVVPIDTLLPALVPLNLGLSITLAARNARSIDVPFLLRRLLPWMALGLPGGILLRNLADRGLLVRSFGVFVVAVALLELGRARRSAPLVPLPATGERGILLAGGIIHGAFATGGPMAVYVASRALPDKGVYRATLSVLWVVLNTVVVASLALGGQLDGAAASLSLVLAPGCVLGLFAGEILHRRAGVATFRLLVYGLLALAGAVLVARG